MSADAVAACPPPAPAPAPPPDQAKPTSASAPIARAPSSAPNLRPTIPPKRNVDVGQQLQRRPAGRCRSVGIGARWNRRRLARAHKGRVHGIRCPLSVLQNLAIVADDPVAACPPPAPAPAPPPDQAKPTSASAPIARAPSSAPNLR